MPRRATLPLIALAVVVLIGFAMLPRRARQTDAAPANVVRGAIHVHSNRSDGSGTPDAIAAAAAAAGLQFVVLTDHGDGTRAPAVPSYRHGVLVIDGVEVNTTGGHFVAMGVPASPYPLAGTPAAVIEDIHRLGGFGVAAHPGSARPSLSWQGWDVPIDGLEWINADSEWRDEARIPIARALMTYILRPPESMATLLDRPAAVLERWDTLAQRRRVIGVAGSDAHARLGFRQRSDPDEGSGLHVRLPGYESTFRTFSNRVVLDAALSGDAAADQQRLLDAVRNGHVYTVVDALATPGSLTFTATSGSRSAQIGDVLPVDGDVVLRASAAAPPGTTLILLRNGQRVHEVTDGTLELNGGRERAAYRIEAYTSGAPGAPPVPWIVSNPIYVGLSEEEAAVPVPGVVSRIPARTAEAAAEFGPRDTSAVVTAVPVDGGTRRFAGDPAIDWTYALTPGAPVGQFAAVAIPISPGLAEFERVQFVVSASSPMRAWVQLRVAAGNAERYGATFFADDTPRTVDIPFTSFAPIGVTSDATVPLDTAAFLLFVVDTLNTLPGTSGRLVISEVGFVK